MAMLAQTMSLDRGSLIGRGKYPRDPSFSSYLNGTEECFVLNLSKKSFSGVEDDDEIGVFSAEKYFNEGLGDGKREVGDKCAIKFQPEPKMVACSETPVKPTIKSGTPSVRSGSSWNSQSALLQRPVMNPSVSGGRKGRGRSYLGSFRCKCVCYDKNSVAVDEYESCHENLTRSSINKLTLKASSNQSPRGSQCRAPGPSKEIYSSITDFCVEDMPVKPRKSLEVFGSPILAKQKKPFSFETEKNLMQSREDDLPRLNDIVIPKVAYADSDSDASSDLFEIEDYTGKVNPFFSRQRSRNRSGFATPTTAYAPSEASIEWSVVTASAADFPVTSEYEELKPSKNTANSKTASTGSNSKHVATNNKPRRRSSSFLACNSQESVKVVGNAHTACEKMFDIKTFKSQDLPAPVFRSQIEGKMTAPDLPRNMQREISSRPPLTQTQSIRIPNILY